MATKTVHRSEANSNVCIWRDARHAVKIVGQSFAVLLQFADERKNVLKAPEAFPYSKIPVFVIVDASTSALCLPQLGIDPVDRLVMFLRSLAAPQNPVDKSLKLFVSNRWHKSRIRRRAQTVRRATAIPESQCCSGKCIILLLSLTSGVYS